MSKRYSIIDQFISGCRKGCHSIFHIVSLLLFLLIRLKTPSDPDKDKAEENTVKKFGPRTLGKIVKIG